MASFVPSSSASGPWQRDVGRPSGSTNANPSDGACLSREMVGGGDATGCPVGRHVAAGRVQCAAIVTVCSGLALAVVVGCGDAGQSDVQEESPGEPCVDAPARICEGSGVRLAWQNVETGLVSMAQKLMGQNGSQYLFVDANCRYWVYDNFPEEAQTDIAGCYPVRTGVLSEEEESRLTEEMGYLEWTRRTEVDSGADAPTYHVWRPGCGMTLSHNLFAPPLGDTELKGWIEVARSWMETLYESGADVEGPLRLRAVANHPERVTSNPPVLETTMLDVSSMAISWDDEAWVSVNDPGILITDPDVVELLRAERPRVAAGEYRDPTNPDSAVLPVRWEGELYYVFYRDTIPLEDGNGLIRPE